MTIIPQLPAPRPSPQLPEYVQNDPQLREAAEKLEASFLAEVLKSAGLGNNEHAFSGGIGEEQFASFLREAQASEMVKTGGIGLAEAIFEALKARTDG